MQSKYINRCTLAGTGHTTDTDSHRISGIRQTLLYHFLGNSLMFRFYTLH